MNEKEYEKIKKRLNDIERENEGIVIKRIADKARIQVFAGFGIILVALGIFGYQTVEI